MIAFNSVSLLAAALAIAACAPADMTRAPEAAAASIDLALVSGSQLESFGDTAIAQTRVRDASGSPMSAVPIKWSVSPAGIVQTLADGKLVAIGNGRVTVIAEVDPASSGVRPGGYVASPLADSVVLDVKQRAVDLALLGADTIFRTIGAARVMRVQAVDRRGHPVAASVAPISWRSEQMSVVTVDSLGVARSRSEGVARIIASSGSASTTLNITVSPRLPHVSCMVYAQRRQSKTSCVSLDFVIREREAIR